MKTMRNFLWFCSGANSSMLKRCPTDSDKYAGIGATVLFTAIMAFLSGSYAFYTIFGQVVASVFFGFIWALMIFNLDRFIVSSIRKEGDLKKEIKMALPRIALAVLIAIVISKPLELRILNSKIQEQMFATNKVKTSQLSSDHKKFVTQNFDDPISKLQEEVTAKESKTPVPLQRLEEKLSGLENEKVTRSRIIEAKNAPFYMQLKQLVADNTTGSHDATINLLKNQISQNRAEIIPLLNEISNIRIQIDNEFASYKRDLDDLRARNNTKIADLETRRKNKIDEFTKDEVTGTTIIDNCKFLPDQIAALSVLKQSDSSINILSNFILLLFLAIEIAPVLVKLFSQRGPYDDLLQKHEHAFQISRIENISRMNQKTNDRLKLVVESGNQSIAAELSGKQELTRRVVAAEMELAQEVINAWKEKEKQNINKNIDKYIGVN